MSEESPSDPAPKPSDFIRDIVARDVAEKRQAGIVTRFPPEPNGYLHLGHAKAICIDFGIALENAGRCNLRMDDTNPAREDVEYVDSIIADVRWLIAGWADHCLSFKARGAKPQASESNGRKDFRIDPIPAGEEGEPFFASDYFEQLYEFALELIRKGKAYVCDLTAEETDAYRGSPDRPGKDSPYRDRSVDENLDLFRRMRAGEFPNGARSLRAKISMASPNIWLRDPLLYRIRHITHHHAGAGWCVYPLYDYAHCLSDYLEGVTHSLCTLEFVDHRPLYDWILESLELPRTLPHQYEFAPLSVGYILMSKRKLRQLVEDKIVNGWDDPRLSTLRAFRRRGVPAAAIRRFVIGAGVTKFDSLTDIAVFEHAVREELNATALRRLGVLRPLKLVLTNIGSDEAIDCVAIDNPQSESPATRTLQLTREVCIEQEDFEENPPPKYFRLKPGGEVRLKYGCIVKCDEVIKDASGRVTEVRCTADLSTRAGGPGADRKVKGTIHWVSAARGIDVEVRLYDRLFTVPEPGVEEDIRKVLNPRSLEIVAAKVEPGLAAAREGECYQFERVGYFVIDPVDSKPGEPVFNRTIALRDTWGKTGK